LGVYKLVPKSSGKQTNNRKFLAIHLYRRYANYTIIQLRSGEIMTKIQAEDNI